MNVQVDSKPTIGRILEALRTEGIKTGDVAKTIDGISEKPLRHALKAAGYVFSNKAPKGWHYIGEGEEPLHASIFDYVSQSNSKVNSSHVLITHSHTEMTETSPILHSQFTHDEVTDLIAMLQEWRRQQAIPEMQKTESPSIYERIKTLPQADKTRKTIVIDQAIGARLDAYCKNERVNKSDVLHLALMDFLDKQ